MLNVYLTGAPLSLLAADVADGHGIADGHLEYASSETIEAARAWNDPTTALRHNCTWEEFRKDAEKRTVWHLACHGRVFPNTILDSTLHFAEAQVSLDQIRAELKSAERRLAILSACESHLTGIANPNEAIGLPSALLHLGFAGVVATAWPISDLATAYLMAYFYHCWLEEGHPPPIALNLAQQHLRNATRHDLVVLLPGLAPDLDRVLDQEIRHPFAHPVYWAAFAYTGV